MAVNRNFYNPKQKANYYGNQLKTGLDKNGNKLKKNQKSYRAGYLKAYHNSVGAYYAQQKKQK